MKRNLLALMLCLISTVYLPRVAESAADEHPLIKMLSLIPDNNFTQGEDFNYLNFHGALEYRLGPNYPKSWQEFGEALQKDRSLVVSALGGMVLPSALFRPGTSIDAIGFDPFKLAFIGLLRSDSAVNREFNLVILDGSFDHVTLGNTLKSHGYTREQFGDNSVWCSSAGCQAGATEGQIEPQYGGFFGEDRGAQFPVVIGPNVVFSSPEYTLIQSMLEANGAFLSASPNYRAAAEATLAEGTLIDAYFVAPTRKISTKMLRARELTSLAALPPLPPYSLLVFSRNVTTENELTNVILVYNSEADAQAAKEALTARLDKFRWAITASKSLREYLGGVDAVMDDLKVVINPTLGKASLILPLRNSLPTNTPRSDRLYVTSGWLFDRLMRMYGMNSNGGMAWLATDLDQ